MEAVDPIVIDGGFAGESEFGSGSPEFDFRQFIEEPLEILVIDVDSDLGRLEDTPAGSLRRKSLYKFLWWGFVLRRVNRKVHI